LFYRNIESSILRSWISENHRFRRLIDVEIERTAQKAIRMLKYFRTIVTFTHKRRRPAALQPQLDPASVFESLHVFGRASAKEIDEASEFQPLM